VGVGEVAFSAALVASEVVPVVMEVSWGSEGAVEAEGGPEAMVAGVGGEGKAGAVE